MADNRHRKVIDSFTFFNEFDILKLRLSYLKDVVDYFIICESNYTFSGKKKPYFLNQAWEELPKDTLAKIINVKYEPNIKTFNVPSKVAETDYSNDHRRIEGEQRDFITRFLQRFDENDIFMLSDADEIPRKRLPCHPP